MEFINALRQFRIGPFAVFDFSLAYAGIFLLAPKLTKIFAKIHLYISRADWLFLTLPIGLLFHITLRLHTPLTKLVLDPNGNYPIKALILFMLFMGLRKCRNPQNIKKS